MNKPTLILIVGLQKSGTTLLSRLLQESTLCVNPFKGEGDDFWGNVPAFSPTASPAGVIYQRSRGEFGHEIGGGEANEHVRAELMERLSRLPTNAQIALNKNPYNTVRLPWLRSLFPSACIVAMIRDPVANVFSLTKKHIPHEGRGLPPEDGWWGVKPRGWREMVRHDKVEQCALQWNAVNRRMTLDVGCVDLLISYRQLCDSPREWVNRILTEASRIAVEAPVDYPPIECFDQEFSRGSRLLSKNRHYRATGMLTAPEDEVVEIGPFDQEQILTIERICRDTAEDCAALR